MAKKFQQWLSSYHNKSFISTSSYENNTDFCTGNTVDGSILRAGSLPTATSVLADVVEVLHKI